MHLHVNPQDMVSCKCVLMLPQRKEKTQTKVDQYPKPANISTYAVVALLV